MNRFVYFLNCGLWLINALTWAAYTHNMGMAFVSLMASTLAGYMWWSERI